MIVVMAGGVAFAQSGGQGSGSAGGSGSSGNAKPPVVVPAPTGTGTGSAGGASGGSKPVTTVPSGTGAGTGTSAGEAHSGQTSSGQPASSQAGSSAKPPVPPAVATKAKFDDWMSSSKEGVSLSGVRQKLMLLAGPAIAAGVPEEAFIARVREAVAKGAPAEVVVEAMAADAKRWMWLAGVLKGESWPPAALSANFYLATTAAMRNGLDEESVDEVVGWAAGAKASAEKVGAALTTTTAILARFGSLKLDDLSITSTDPNAGSIVLCLAKSRLRVGQFPEIEEIAARAAALGIDATRFRLALEATIGQGKRLADFEKALFG